MIARISSGNNLYGVLAYNQEKIDKEMGKVLGCNLIFEPADGKFKVSNCLSEFMNFVPSHFRTENPVFHVSLNPHPDDVILDETLADIGREYMERMGYGNQPYMIFKHEDIDRHHLHIVSLRVDHQGKKINSYKEYRRSKKITEDIEQKYRLKKGEGNAKQENWELSPLDTSKGELKKQIASLIKPVAAMYHFQSMGEYKAVLSLYNIHVEELRGENKGKPYRGLIYQAVDGVGNKVGKPIKSSVFGKSVGYDGLDKRMAKSKEKIKEKNLKTHTLTAVASAKSRAKSESEFRALLREDKIDVLLRRNEQGRIYGTTFIDHSTRCALNGSRLGKEFSANVFNELFKEADNTPQSKVQAKLSDAYNSGTASEQNKYSAGLLSILPQPDLQEENRSFIPRRKKKKRRRYGRQG